MRFSHLHVLPERPHLGPMKGLDSAATSFQRLANGQLSLTIKHDAIRGVTPRMLRWWFEHLGETLTHAGTVYPRYLLWHPRDHIRWELARQAPNGSSGQGAYFRIVEAFDANPDFYVDSTEYVERLDTTGISLVRKVCGVEIFRLEHDFGMAENGASYHSRMTFGAEAGRVGRFFNRYIGPRLLSEAGARAWLKHNIEEVSMFEHILPPLYAANETGASLRRAA